VRIVIVHACGVNAYLLPARGDRQVTPLPPLCGRDAALFDAPAALKCGLPSLENADAVIYCTPGLTLWCVKDAKCSV
jgi:hypothetical protein